MERWRPRMRRIFSSGSESNSWPWKRIRPPTTRPGGSGTSPITESAVTLLPQPLSPTTPSVPPGGMEKDTSSTASTGLSSRENRVFRPRTSRRGSVMGRDSGRGANRPARPSLPGQLVQELLLLDDALLDQQPDEGRHHLRGHDLLHGRARLLSLREALQVVEHLQILLREVRRQVPLGRLHVL